MLSKACGKVINIGKTVDFSNIKPQCGIMLINFFTLIHVYFNQRDAVGANSVRWFCFNSLFFIIFRFFWLFFHNMG
ncbi:hypothetical protein BTJ39_05820 [Izhakiella australiensis]|uniref:Uncharacterized protein n=1 Tax=Izhakiella australiensis TaxID=1926881 RepID=A0A1S8YS45_9GAMM|nr:hypothetical protein BTJ39_05820 [Izhakiella australiensis]